MAVKLYENLQGIAFNIHTGTGRPNIPIPGTPKVWLDERVADAHPEWFSLVEVKEEEPQERPADDQDGIEIEVDLEDDGPSDETEADLLNIDAIMEGADKMRSKADLDDYAEGFGVKLDARRKMAEMKETLREELEKKNA